MTSETDFPRLPGRLTDLPVGLEAVKAPTTGGQVALAVLVHYLDAPDLPNGCDPVGLFGIDPLVDDYRSIGKTPVR